MHNEYEYIIYIREEWHLGQMSLQMQSYWPESWYDLSIVMKRNSMLY